jgi:hypothetical protein
MRLILTDSLLLFAFLAHSRAQSNPCVLKVKEAPEVRGFKLGQTYVEVIKGLPKEAGPLTYFHPESVRHVEIVSGLRVARLFPTSRVRG